MKTIPNKITVPNINLACKILRGSILIDYYNGEEGLVFVGLVEGNVTVLSIKGTYVTQLPVKLTNTYEYPIKAIYTTHELDKEIIILTTEDGNEIIFPIQKEQIQETTYREFILHDSKNKITGENLRDFENSLPLKHLARLNGYKAIKHGFITEGTGYLYQRKENNYSLIIIPIIYEIDGKVKGEKIRDRLIYQSFSHLYK